MSYWLKTDWLPTAAVLTEELRGIRVILVLSTANLKKYFYKSFILLHNFKFCFQVIILGVTSWCTSKY
jgi:hypothetical protein